VKLTTAIRDYVLLAFVYLLLVLLLPANQVIMKHYHISAVQYHILYFTVALPLVAIWFTAFYGAGKLSQYSNMIKKSAEGDGFTNLARGTTWLAWSLPIPALVTLCASAVANNHPGFQGASVIITEYATLVMALMAFTLLSRGARSLTTITHTRLNLEQSRLVIVLFLLLGVGYCYFTFKSLDLHSLTSTNNPYYLPVWLLITTVTVPYLYAWFSGLLAAYELLLYSRKVSGVLYRQSMSFLAFGCVGIIAASVCTQYLLSVVSQSGHLSLNATLLFINIMYVLMAASYIMIGIGAHRLKKIEEI
jgi:hypothetical protein